MDHPMTTADLVDPGNGDLPGGRYYQRDAADVQVAGAAQQVCGPRAPETTPDGDTYRPHDGAGALRHHPSDSSVAAGVRRNRNQAWIARVTHANYARPTGASRDRLSRPGDTRDQDREKALHALTLTCAWPSAIRCKPHPLRG
jgi:hypothetical protein